MNEYGANVRRIRKEKGLSMQNIADKLNCSMQAVSQYERGTRKITLETAKKLAAALDVPLDSLIELEYTEDGPRIPPTEEERKLERMDAELAHDVLTGKTSPEDARILKPFRHLNNDGRDKVVAYASDLEGNPKYQRIQ